MRRREFITLLGGTALWPIGVRAQRAERMRRIGVLMGSAESDPESVPRVTAFERGLMELGWVSGRNVLIDYRWAAGEPAHMQVLAKELVELQPECFSRAAPLSWRRSAVRLGRSPSCS